MQICICAAVSIMLSQRLCGLEMQNTRQIKYTYFVHSTTICSALCSMYFVGICGEQWDNILSFNGRMDRETNETEQNHY